MERPSGDVNSVGSDIAPTKRRDHGSTMVEILVSIVLLGTASIAILIALRTSIHGSVVDKNLATAYEYVQSVSDQIYEAPRVPCYQTPATAAL